jgi:hypothetical protein
MMCDALPCDWHTSLLADHPGYVALRVRRLIQPHSLSWPIARNGRYKRNARGSLRQWQVLVEPQAGGGYLLTTEGGQVDGAITRGRGTLIAVGKVNRTARAQAELQVSPRCPTLSPARPPE